MTYKDVEGFFDFEDVYASAVSRYMTGTFVEVGAWYGRSSIFMATLIKQAGRNIRFYAVDTWKGSIEHKDVLEKLGGDMFPSFIKNVKDCDVEGYVTPLQMTSIEAAGKFLDGSLEFVYIDASHEYEPCRDDIVAWLPKVKRGGFLAGHDYYAHGVQQALREVLPSAQKYLGFTGNNSWIYFKNDYNPLAPECHKG